MVRRGQAALAHLWVVSIIVISFGTRWIRIVVVVRAELLLRIVVHHIDFRQVQLLVLENVAARFAHYTIHVADAGDVLTDERA